MSDIKWNQNSKGEISSGRIIARKVVNTGVLVVIVGCFISIWDVVNHGPMILESSIFASGTGIIGLGLGFQGWHKSSETKKDVAEISTKKDVAEISTKAE